MTIFIVRIFTILVYKNVKYLNTSYEQDDNGVLLVDFLKRSQQRKVTKTILEVPEIPDYIEKKIITLDNVEKHAFYCVCGYIISKISKNYKVCEECIHSAGSKKYDSSYKYCKFLRMRCYKEETLFFVNNDTFNYFYEMEIIIRRYLLFLRSLGIDCDLLHFFLGKMNHIKHESLKNCHNLDDKIMKYFIKYRIKINCVKERLRRPLYNSITMAMHSTIK